MKKLMRFITKLFTTIGRRIKHSVLLFACFFLLGCPKEESYSYKIEINNQTESNLQITTKSMGTIDFIEDFSFETFIIRPNSKYSDGLFELKTENPVADFLEGWGGNNRFRLSNHDTLLVDWRGPAYSGEEEDHNFYNINAWEVDDTPKSFDVTYTITFTIYPEDLKQDETD